MPSVVTANDLASGAVIYLDASGHWVPRLEDAAAVSTPDEIRSLEAHALAALSANRVTAVYAFEVHVEGGRPVPLSVRERLRATQAAA
jgi:hypothetical protein